MRCLCRPPMSCIELLSPSDVINGRRALREVALNRSRGSVLDAIFVQALRRHLTIHRLPCDSINALEYGGRNDARGSGLDPAISIQRFSIRADRQRKKWNVADCALGPRAAGRRSLA